MTVRKIRPIMLKNCKVLVNVDSHSLKKKKTAPIKGSLI